jgi:hypothetical protein
MMQAAEKKQEATAKVLDLAEILMRLVGEVDTSAETCAKLQWSISTILEKVHHPDLGAEIHMLQDVDRLQQTLFDIASILRVAAEASPSHPLNEQEVNESIRLESLRHRLGLSETLPGVSPPEDENDITWF